jgi:hypothetical protein
MNPHNMHNLRASEVSEPPIKEESFPLVTAPKIGEVIHVNAK